MAKKLLVVTPSPKKRRVAGTLPTTKTARVIVRVWAPRKEGDVAKDFRCQLLPINEDCQQIGKAIDPVLNARSIESGKKKGADWWFKFEKDLRPDHYYIIESECTVNTAIVKATKTKIKTRKPPTPTGLGARFVSPPEIDTPCEYDELPHQFFVYGFGDGATLCKLLLGSAEVAGAALTTAAERDGYEWAASFNVNNEDFHGELVTLEASDGSPTLIPVLIEA